MTYLFPCVFKAIFVTRKGSYLKFALREDLRTIVLFFKGVLRTSICKGKLVKGRLRYKSALDLTEWEKL